MPFTRHLHADDPEQIAEAAHLLRSGGLVAFATETVYGLGADALSPRAVANIFEAKGRPSWDPLIVHVADLTQVEQIALVPENLRDRFEKLARAFWPGPLTLLLPRADAVPLAVTAGRALVGVRIPMHAAARQLLRQAGVPVAAPSANRFGHVSPTTAAHVLADLEGRIDAVLDAGPCRVGVESTVLDPGQTPMMLYRAGAVSPQELREATGVNVTLFKAVQRALDKPAASPQGLPSPGVGIRHYAPHAKMVLSAGDPESLWKQAVLESATHRTGVLLPLGWPLPPGVVAEPWALWQDAAARAATLFAALRALDTREVEVIVCPLPTPGGLEDAIRDRLEKAARAA